MSSSTRIGCLSQKGSAIKYICRHTAKGGEEDIKKAIHYLEMILERDYADEPIFKPQTEWVPPFEFPDLSKYDEIAIDLETKDPDLKTKGTAATRVKLVML